MIYKLQVLATYEYCCGNSTSTFFSGNINRRAWLKI